MKGLTLLALRVLGSVASSSTETRGEAWLSHTQDGGYHSQTLGMVNCFPRVGLRGRGARYWLHAEGASGRTALVRAKKKKVTRNAEWRLPGQESVQWEHFCFLWVGNGPCH